MPTVDVASDNLCSILDSSHNKGTKNAIQLDMFNNVQ